MSTKQINIYKEYKERVLSNSIRVEKLLKQIDIEDSCHIILNFSDCIIDYPNTSQIIDSVLSQLSANNCEEKSFTIQCDFIPNEEITLNYLFIGSKFMNIETSKAYKLNALKKIISEKFSTNRITFSLEEVNELMEVIRTIPLSL